MMKRNISLSIIALLLGGTHLETTAQTNTQKQPIGIDFFSKVQAISDVKTIGNDIFFVIRKANIKDDKYTSDLYQLVDGRAKALTTSGTVGGYDVLADAIILKKRDKGQTVFLELTKGYGEATEWLRLPYSVGQVKYISRQHFFFTASYKLHQTNDRLPDSLKAKDANKRYRIFDELPFWSNGRGDINGSRQVLYEYKNGQVKALTDSLQNAGGLALSPDHRYLAYTISDKKSFRIHSNQLHIYSIAEQTSKQLGIKDSTSYGSLQFIDGQRLFLTAKTHRADNPQANSQFYHLSIHSGQFKQVYNGEPYELGGGLATDTKGGNHSEPLIDKDGIIFNTTAIDRLPLVRLSWKDETVTPLTPLNYDVDAYLRYQKGFLLLASEGQNGQEFYLFDGKNEPKRISDINTSTFASHQVVTPQEIKYINGAGQEQRGYILPPTNFESGKKYPTILDIHGGPRAAYGAGFFHEMQYWANQGYAVIFANPRGGSGQGSDYAQLKGDFGGRDYDDIMAFVDAAIAQFDYIDKDRLGVTGGSYGGVMTNWIIGHTDRFRAAASQRSISNWVSLEALSDIGYNFGWGYIGADPWTNNQELWKKSPLAYANKVKTPTLFIHSDEDYRCPLPEGLQMYSALQYFGVASRIVIFKGENHELSRSGRPLNRIKRLQEITNWFNKYLK
ncbi:S9 family peptidase [Prevotella sp. P6B4]|uniref:alpha/beta hydrolase family protein n=1 Tax=Prevotella sp. P6B4 TaxID=1410614 RepID=UPI0009DFBACC|nr:S9 family peptidase [Prevotella sp. P6B4]